MRAFLSVSDKTGPGRVRAAVWPPWGSSSCRPAAPPRRWPRPGLPVVSVSDVTGFPGDDGRPGQDAPPASTAASWRAGIARTTSRHSRARHHPDRSRRREPLSVREGGGRTPTRRSTIWSRRSTSAARAWSAPRPRTFATSSSSSIRRTIRACSRSSRAPGGPSLEFRFELMQKAFAHTAQYDTMIADDAGDGRGRRTGR